MTDELNTILDGTQEGDDAAKADRADELNAQANEPQEPTEEEHKEEPPMAAEKPDKPESWTKAAVMDERRKRQALEQELQALRGQRVSEDKAQQLTDRIQYSRNAMAKAYPDFEELEAEFVELAQKHPPLAVAMATSEDPAGFAYEQAKLAREYKAMKDIDTYKANIRAEVKAEVLREMQIEGESRRAKEEAITPSLAKGRGAGTKGDAHVSESLEDILGR